MSGFDSFFTDGDKPFAENLNDALLVSNVYDLTVPISLPADFSNGEWIDTEARRKCSVAIVQVTDFNGLTIDGDELIGTDALEFDFYPNFNNFGRLKRVDWTGDVDEVIIKDANGNVLTNVIECGDLENLVGLRTLQNFQIIVRVSGTLFGLTFTLENKTLGNGRYTVQAGISNISGLESRLSSIESKNTSQDTRLSSIEDVNTAQGTRLENVESVNNTQNTRLTALDTWASRSFNLNGYAYTGYYNAFKATFNILATLRKNYRFSTSFPYSPLNDIYLPCVAMYTSSVDDTQVTTYYPIIIKLWGGSGNLSISTLNVEGVTYPSGNPSINICAEYYYNLGE